jgi:hypothetical protein
MVYKRFTSGRGTTMSRSRRNEPLRKTFSNPLRLTYRYDWQHCQDTAKKSLCGAGLCAVFSIFTLNGCQSIINGEPNFNTSLLLPSYTDANNQIVQTPSEHITPIPQPIPQSCLHYDIGPSDTLRNSCIYSLKSDIDDSYREYRITLHHLVDYGNAGFDIASLGLSTAATATATAAAKTVLSAINTGVTGTKTALNQDLLFKQSIELITTQMDADRNEEFAVMLKEMQNTSSPYTLDQAKNDLLVYYAAGTWDHAITSLQAKTSANLANCQAAVNNAKSNGAVVGSISTSTGCPQSITVTYSFDSNSSKIDAFWKPDGKIFNKDNEAKIQGCMTKNGITESIFALINGDFAQDRIKVVSCLSL